MFSLKNITRKSLSILLKDSTCFSKKKQVKTPSMKIKLENGLAAGFSLTPYLESFTPTFGLGTPVFQRISSNLHSGTPTFSKICLWDSCFQNPSESPVQWNF